MIKVRSVAGMKFYKTNFLLSHRDTKCIKTYYPFFLCLGGSFYSILITLISGSVFKYLAHVGLPGNSL